jgi:hypothetical protein
VGSLIRGFEAKPIHACETRGLSLTIEQAIAYHVQEGGWWRAVKGAADRVGNGRVGRDRGILAARAGAADRAGATDRAGAACAVAARTARVTSSCTARRRAPCVAAAGVLPARPSG